MLLRALLAQTMKSFLFKLGFPCALLKSLNFSSIICCDSWFSQDWICFIHVFVWFTEKALEEICFNSVLQLNILLNLILSFFLFKFEKEIGKFSLTDAHFGRVFLLSRSFVLLDYNSFMPSFFNLAHFNLFL